MRIWNSLWEQMNTTVSIYKAILAATHSPAGPGAVWLWGLIGAAAVAIVLLLIKIRLLHKAAKEIQTDFADRLATDTNTLIHISSGDRAMRSLAASLNRELVTLRAQRQRFQQGDQELKNAVTNISHDLRTPLTAICGYLDLLEAELTEAPEQKCAAKRGCGPEQDVIYPQGASAEQNISPAASYIAIIRNRAEALKTLTEELFRYSVIAASGEDIRRETVVLNEALEDSIAAHYTALKGHGIAPRIQMPEEKLVRSLDHFALSRILSNLLSNSVKYSGGNLDISLSDNGEIVFANTAPALDKVQLGRLFDRFYTVNSGQRSTGLGLSIARTLTERMGGRIWAEYEDGTLYVHVLFPEPPSAPV